ERPGQRAALAFGAETQVDAVSLAALGVGRQQAQHFTDDAGVELAVVDAGDAPAARAALLVIHEHKVEVAAVVQLLAAQFAKSEDDAAGRRAGAGVWLAEAVT